MPPFPPFPRLAKDLPGAILRYQPADLHLYGSDPWDVRISLGDAPLEEAYYITIDDDTVLDLPIADILDRYALNPEHRHRLDVAESPELPILMDELAGYWQAAKDGRMAIDIHINHAPTGEPVQWQEAARGYLSTCSFEDGSYDYRVLDLIFRLRPTAPPEEELASMQARYGPLFLLGLLQARQDPPLFPDETASPRLAAAFRALLEEGWIRMEGAGLVHLTAHGLAEGERIAQETHELQQTYERFAAVSLFPPALGVPGGFDVRLQMMEKDGLDPLDGLFLLSFAAEGEWLFHDPDWMERFESGRLFSAIHEKRAFMTGFTREALAALSGLVPP